jgi:GNAT superfamily N-acetyltransferase
MQIKTMFENFIIRESNSSDVPIIFNFIKGLAAYEKLSHEVVATEEGLRRTLFGDNPKAEVILGYYKNDPVAFALFFYNYSTFLGKPGIYLEDLFVLPEMRGKGFGKVMLAYLAKLAKERDCGRLEWSVLDWNEPALKFYKSIGARKMEEWTTQRLDGDALSNLADQFSN